MINKNDRYSELHKTHYFGATQPGTELQNTPYTSGEFYGYREVHWSGRSDTEGHLITVELHEQYPIPGRVWYNMFNVDDNAWSGWESTMPTEHLVKIKAGLIWDSHAGFTFADSDSEVYIANGNHIMCTLKAKGSITVSDTGSVQLGILKSAYRPRVKQTRITTINKTTSGQINASAAITINPNGWVNLITGEASKTYGNTSYPWTTSDGESSFDWWI